MIAKEFPNNVATMFAVLETFFGIGMIMGPTIGGALYELGGFTLPFVSLGCEYGSFNVMAFWKQTLASISTDF